MPSQLLRLNLGCGDKILEGYTNVDVAESRAGKQPDVLCDLKQEHAQFKLREFRDMRITGIKPHEAPA